MKRLAVGILAFAIIGCSMNPPTSPSALDPASATTASITTATTESHEQKVIVHFFSDEFMGGGKVHIVDLPVTITGSPSGTVRNETTGKHGLVSVWLPSGDSSVEVRTDVYSGFCSVTVTLPLPLHGNVDSWILIHRDC